MARGLRGNKAMERRDRFAREWVIDHNGKRAAIAAGFKSGKTASQMASKMLAEPRVRKLIEKYSKKAAEKLEITAEKVLNEIARMAFVDPRNFFNEDGTIKNVHELDDQTAAALAGMDIFEEFQGRGKDRRLIGYTKKFKIADKGANLERLGRWLKLFTEKVEHTGEGGKPIQHTVGIGSLAELAAEITRERNANPH